MPRHSLDANKSVYGYEILDLVGNIVTWPMCIALILVRNHASKVFQFERS